MPIISTIRAASLVMGLVIPMERPTVLREDAKSNMASIKVQPAVTVITEHPSRAKCIECIKIIK